MSHNLSYTLLKMRAGLRFTGLHKLYKVGEEHVSVPLTEALHVILHLASVVVDHEAAVPAVVVLMGADSSS